MKTIKKIINYIQDNHFKIIYIDNDVDIVNYSKILEVKENVITIEKDNRLILIKGSNLKLNKLLDNEVLITGIIKEIVL